MSHGLPRPVPYVCMSTITWGVGVPAGRSGLTIQLPTER